LFATYTYPLSAFNQFKNHCWLYYAIEIIPVAGFNYDSIISDRKGREDPMNTNELQLKALGDFIKSRRAKLTPSNIGLPPGYKRRRTPGLRREEVAQLRLYSSAWKEAFICFTEYSNGSNSFVFL
jgi:hypothetical protein